MVAAYNPRGESTQQSENDPCGRLADDPTAEWTTQVALNVMMDLQDADAALGSMSGFDESVRMRCDINSRATLPILILYAVGRRQLLSGLTAGFSK